MILEYWLEGGEEHISFRIIWTPIHRDEWQIFVREQNKINTNLIWQNLAAFLITVASLGCELLGDIRSLHKFFPLFVTLGLNAYNSANMQPILMRFFSFERAASNLDFLFLIFKIGAFSVILCD